MLPKHRLGLHALVLVLVAALSAAPAALAQETVTAEEPLPAYCERSMTADVVALDQVYFWNRLGAVQPHGMIYALKRDVVPADSSYALGPGNAALREDKRPRPLTLRMNVGDCLTVNFTNLLAKSPVDDEQPATRTASVHVSGLQLVHSIADNGIPVGQNTSGLAAPGETRTYTFYAEREGTFLLYSGGALAGGEGNNGSIAAGLFGAVNVEPAGSEWYRSQVTEEDMRLGTKKTKVLQSDGTYQIVDALTPAGHPLLNYDARYPKTHPRAGLPIFKMLHNGEIVHSDLTAIITGPNRGNFPAGTYRPNPVYPNRDEAFREFTIIFHDEIGAVQAFPIFNDPVFVHTTHSGRDAFAINYGTGGIGAEILANRLGVGPMYDCTDCLYEEFFLTSWAVGDPAMVVDVPANAPCTVEDVQSGNVDSCAPTPGPKATKAFYPDDPSNVYHSYLNDHVKFRNLLAGSDDHHIFHLHAHQWLHTPNSDKSAYLDSQAIGQNTGFTYEIAHNGSGNRNQTAGDSIFHCHFYPHFAQGMWGHWRVHDVFERGTELDAYGRPAKGSRALPDGEIMAGTPIPGVVPLPPKVMPPMPQATATIVGGQVQVSGTGNPGYPFWIPGVAGHRPPHPPLDTLHDGGLPRHVVTGGKAYHVETRLDFTKEMTFTEAKELSEKGEPVELAAMDFHAQRWHKSYKPDGTSGAFKANGLPPTQGAPYADPCIDDSGQAVGKPRLFKAADIQLDVVLNKAGWHYPQQRIISLWEDVDDFKFGSKPPEPLFFRSNSNDCITFYLTNLVPKEFELDDFQVRTPTDILGQHIHLVKFDVTSSDGSANGFNYEDGSFSPEEVVHRIETINLAGGLLQPDGTRKKLEPKYHPFAPFQRPEWLGAQTTIQRWYADPTLDLTGDDRTLRTVFTHDHFGPSTHQQIGLYAGLVVEPEGSVWYHNETNEQLGTRHDGGPTSWQARILPPNSDESYREFLFEFSDFQLAYLPNDKQPLPYEHRARLPGEGFDDPDKAINPPGRVEIGLPHLYQDPKECPGGVVPPCPELISADDPGMYSINYRNEPLALRLRDPGTNSQALGQQGDPSYAYSSNVKRADPDLNVQPTFYPPLTGGLHGTDPFTPLLRAYEGDNVQIRILVGGHEEEHNFTVNGVKWLFEPSDPNSGYRGSQMMGISEHFEFLLPQLPKAYSGSSADYLYKPGAAVESQWNGNWGILRSYVNSLADLPRLPNNPAGTTSTALGDWTGVCPKSAPTRSYNVVAVPAKALPGGTLTYNSRVTAVSNLDTGAAFKGPLQDPTAIVFVRAEDYDFSTRTVDQLAPVEPLILRAAAGDCVSVTLYNELPPTKSGLAYDLDGYNAFANIVDFFNANKVKPSARVGLHPQLLAYDVTRSDGVNVGLNPEQTVPPGQKIAYQWYAGDITWDDATQSFVATPIEFGSTGLTSSDPLKHTNKGAVGALIVEPQGSKWQEDYTPGTLTKAATTRASARVYKPDGTSFREHVMVFQNDVNLRYGDNQAVQPTPETEDPTERGNKALNYRTEPIWYRMGIAPETSLGATRKLDFTDVLTNAFIGGAEPQTPVFTSTAGEPTRFRVVHPGGHGQASVFELTGHIWEEEPYVKHSTVLGSNPLSEWKGTQHGHGATNHFDVLVKNGAGGKFAVPGDYLVRDFVHWMFYQGLWGVFRVVP